LGASLAVTIVNHRQWAWLEGCLKSLLKHPYSGGPFEIVVLDNASDDGSVELIRRQFPRVVVLDQQLRRGFGANQNIAIRATTAELIFVLNPDTIVYESALDSLVDVMDSDPAIVLAGGPILNDDGSTWSESPLAFPTPGRTLRRAIGLHKFVAPHSCGNQPKRSG